jgi:phage terminase large subunit-like protein
MLRRMTMYDRVRGDGAVRFFERLLVHTKGQHAGKPFTLEPWQRDDIIKPLFGTLNPDGTRQYRRAYVEIPRKNGKSTLAAGVALYLLFADNEQGAEVYGAACDRDQASIVFNVAAEMVRRSPTLARMCKVIDSTKRIVVGHSFYRAIPADAGGSHGFNASGIIFDELHAQPNRDLWDVLNTSTGARAQPLTFQITTAGYDRNSICWEQHDYAAKVLAGVIDDPTFFAYIRAAGDEDDWRDPATWAQANPGLGVTVRRDYLEAECRRAQETPAYENTFRRLHLNQWTRQETRWLQVTKWDACGGDVQEKLHGRHCYAGLDLASTTDIAALVLVFPIDEPVASVETDAGESLPVVQTHYDVLPFFWIPDEAMRERSHRDRVPYDVWVREGLIQATEGNVIDYRAIMETFDRLAQLYDIREVGFDRWGSTQLITEMQEAGLSVVPIGQGFASMSAPTKELLNLVLARRIRHGGNPVLRWMADNMVVRTDPAGNIKPDKGRSSEKIDGMVALVMAIDRASRNENKLSVYDEE